jgi:acyl carrier protein
MSQVDIAEVSDFLASEISRRTGVPQSALGQSTVLVDIGLQSLDAVMICGEIEDKYAIEVEPTMMFEYRTFGEVLQAVWGLLATV